MSEQRLLSAVLNRDGFELIQGAVDDSEVSPHGWQLIGYVGEFYGKHNKVTDIDRETLCEYLKLAIPNPKHVKDFTELVASLPKLESPEAVAALVREQKIRATGLKLATAFQAGEEVEDLLSQWEELKQDPTDDNLIDLSDPDAFNETFAQVDDRNRIRLWPKRLQEKTNGALPGHHIVLYGRPERGKTLMTVNMVAGFLHDGLRVYYVGNEDPIVSVQARIATRLAGTTNEAFQATPASFHKTLVGRNIGNLQAERLSPGNIGEIEKGIRKYRPDVLVVDQLRNLRPRGGKNDNITNRIDNAAQEVRELLGKHALLGISIAQAGSGEYGENDNKPYLSESDIDSSKTGLPGACDLLVGIGATREMLTSGQRGLSLCKNKLNGNTGARFTVRFDIQRNRVE